MSFTPGNIETVSGARRVEGRQFAIVSAEFNKVFCDRLVQGATKAFLAHGANSENINIFWVPGSFELPLAAKTLAESGKVSGIVALGVIIKGDTDHYSQVARESSVGLAQVMMETGIPVASGLIPALNVAQVEERSQVPEQGPAEGNKGWEAACAVIEMADLLNKLKEL